MTEAPTVLLDVKDGIATVTLNRPEQRNALNLAMCDDLLRVMTEINRDELLVAQLIGNVAFDNALREALNNGRLADAGFAD